MATRIFSANHGNDRLVISTICTHLVFFHEGGFEFRTERKQRTRVAPWNPATWRGFNWIQSDDAEQPVGMQCTFTRRTGVNGSSSDFGVTQQSTTGFFKSSCDYLALRPHCIYVAVGDFSQSSPDSPAPGNDARSVKNVVLQFTYGGQERTLRHSNGS